uniref:Reverse transcriptase N-terminal domain-containing protein n=1 Tax=Dicranema revolutum TaxID=239144 RepID=A0A4D6WUN1_9FLOR|nr:hypothetical protein [Dicranema revolutum]
MQTQTINLDCLLLWQSLPWQKISQRIFILQERMYKLSKQCNQYYVYKIQDYILNCSDAKLLAIQVISNSLNQYYVNNDKEKYQVHHIDKLYIYKYFYHDTACSQKYKIIIEYIKQYLVYLSINPEWKARLEPVYKFNASDNTSCHFIYRISNFFSKNYSYKSSLQCINPLSTYLSNKYINLNYLLKRMCALPSISLYIQYWLHNQYFLEPLQRKICILNSTNKYMINSLVQLLYHIIYNGIEWYSIMIFQYDINSMHIFKNLYLASNINNVLKLYINSNYLQSKITYLKKVKYIYKEINLYHLNSFCNYNNLKAEHIGHAFKYCFDARQGFNSLYNAKNKVTMQIQPYVYQNLIDNIKSLLYYSNYFGKLKRYRAVNYSNVLMKINKMIINFYKYYYPLINASNVYLLLNLLNNTLLKWMKVKNDKIKLLFWNNKYLNYQFVCII